METINLNGRDMPLQAAAKEITGQFARRADKAVRKAKCPVHGTIARFNREIGNFDNICCDIQRELISENL